MRRCDICEGEIDEAEGACEIDVSTEQGARKGIACLRCVSIEIVKRSRVYTMPGEAEHLRRWAGGPNSPPNE